MDESLPSKRQWLQHWKPIIPKYLYKERLIMLGCYPTCYQLHYALN